MDYLRIATYPFAKFIDGLISKPVRDALRILKFGDNATLSEITEFRNQAFNDLVDHAYKNVPYYQNIMDEYGIPPKSIQSLEDLERFPILTKDAIRLAGDGLRAINYSDNACVRRRSGGTTGEPIASYVDYRAQALETYACFRGFEWMGWRPGLRIVRLFGGSLGQPVKYSFRHQAREFALGRISLPAFELDKNNVGQYIEKINQTGECILVGYASAIYNLALYAKEQNLVPKNINCVFSTSEVMPDHWKNIISQVFSCPVKNYYGCGEINSLGFQVAESGLYWIPDEHVHIESIDNENSFSRIRQENNLIVTSLFNYAQPLIRYQNDDLGEILKPGVEHPTRHCIVNFAGRSADMFIRPDGSRISSILGTFIIQKTQIKVKKYQLIQYAYDNVQFRYEPMGEINEQDLLPVVKILRDHVNPSLDVEFIETDEFILSESGKFRIMVVDPEFDSLSEFNIR